MTADERLGSIETALDTSDRRLDRGCRHQRDCGCDFRTDP